MRSARVTADDRPPAPPPAGTRRADGRPQPSRPPVLEPTAPQEGQGSAIHSRAQPARAPATSQPQAPCRLHATASAEKGEGVCVCVCVSTSSTGPWSAREAPSRPWAPGTAWTAHRGGPCGQRGPPGAPRARLRNIALLPTMPRFGQGPGWAALKSRNCPIYPKNLSEKHTLPC